MEEIKFTPKQWVLVRDSYTEPWRLNIYSHIKGKYFFCVGSYWCYCIPYEGNEHLLGTTDEPKEPYEPKEGDFVYVKCKNRREYIFVKGRGTVDKTDYYFSYNLDDEIFGSSYKVCGDYEISEIRLATEEEKQFLLDKMHEAGIDWDAENKKVVDWKWQPDEGERFCYPTFDEVLGKYSVYFDYWSNDLTPQWKREHKFKENDECQALCDKLNEAIQNVK